MSNRNRRKIAIGRFIGVFWAALIALALLPSLAAAQAALAARRSDSTNHGGAIVQGSPSVLIAGQPAARLGDFASCPLACPGGAPHTGGLIATGSTTVLVNGQRAARAGSVVNETCAASTIANGATTVRIGP